MCVTPSGARQAASEAEKNRFTIDAEYRFQSGRPAFTALRVTGDGPWCVSDPDMDTRTMCTPLKTQRYFHRLFPWLSKYNTRRDEAIDYDRLK